MAGKQELDLSGVWHGVFNYPPGRNREPTNFTATLAESGGWLNGSTQEIGVAGNASGLTITATVQGRREDRSVVFLKLYDGAYRSYDTVRYQGDLNDDATEIEGVWSIPGNWSGSFLMIRAGAEPIAVEREAFQEI